MNRLVYFEQIAGSARKFYLMTEDDGGSTFTANYGRIGTTVAEDAIVCKNAVIGDDAYYTSRFTKL